MRCNYQSFYLEYILPESKVNNEAIRITAANARNSKSQLSSTLAKVSLLSHIYLLLRTEILGFPFQIEKKII